ncbi:MAG: hypothetical protein IJO54_05710 [Oscillospiraceae bacterium]|nr:hypothetical protein [Oscillospiraceae bacterium]
MDKSNNTKYSLDKDFKCELTNKDFTEGCLRYNVLTDPEVVYILTAEEKAALADKTADELWKMLYVRENVVNGDVYAVWIKLKMEEYRKK